MEKKEEKILIGSGFCPFCGKDNRVEVTEAQMAGYDNWRNGMNIQDAMPGLSASKREVLISGICLNCQKTTFSSENEYRDEDDEQKIIDDMTNLSDDLSDIGYAFVIEKELKSFEYDDKVKRLCIKIDTVLNKVSKYDYDYETCEFTEKELEILNKYNMIPVPVKYADDDLPF